MCEGAVGKAEQHRQRQYEPRKAARFEDPAHFAGSSFTPAAGRS